MESHLGVPVERDLAAHEALEREIGRLRSLEDRALDRGREEGEAGEDADAGLGPPGRAGKLGKRGSGLEGGGPAMCLGERAEEDGVRPRDRIADDQPGLDAAAVNRAGFPGGRFV